jgi:transposase
MSALSVQGRLFFKIPSERVNATVFIDFLKELLAEYPKRKIFVIADQASPHIAKSVKAFAAGQKRLELFYLPAYSPDFNPDEGVWSHLKSQELKAHQATNKEELIKKTHEALKRMAKRPVLIRSFFKRCNITYIMKRPIQGSVRHSSSSAHQRSRTRIESRLNNPSHNPTSCEARLITTSSTNPAPTCGPTRIPWRGGMAQRFTTHRRVG